MMLIVIGLPLSRALLSMGMSVLIITALFQQHFLEKIKNLYHVRTFAALHILFLLVVLSGLWSEDKIFWLERVRIKLPLLLLPASFYVLMPIERKALLIIHAAYFWIIFLCCLWSTTFFIADYQNILQSYSKGNVMFTPVNHIRFSLMTVMACVIGIELLQENYRSRWVRAVIIIAMAAMIIYLHLLAVRSGLLALYATAFTLTGRYIIQTRSYRLGIFLLIATILLPLCAFYFSPTLKSKLYYMRYDLENYFSGRYDVFGSDTRRLLSFRAGLIAGHERPWFGHGYGDVRRAVIAVFEEKFPSVPEKNRLMPHNQFIFTYVGLGVVGIVVLLWSFFSPMCVKQSWNNIVLLSLTVMIFTSFFSEYTLETQIGVAFYLFFLLTSLTRQLKG